MTPPQTPAHVALEAARRALLLPFLPLYIAGLRRAARRCETPSDAVELAFTFRFRGLNIGPHQNRREIQALLEFLAERRLRSIVEVGTAKGGTFFLLARIADPGATLVSVDLPGAWLRGRYPKWKAPLYRSFARHGQAVHLLRGDSHDPRMPSRVSRLLPGGTADFLLIDGDHSYDGARRDFELYAPLVEHGGILAMHDIVPGPPEKVGGVPRLWQEVKGHYPHREFVDDWGQGGFGIGVLFIGGTPATDPK